MIPAEARGHSISHAQRQSKLDHDMARGRWTGSFPRRVTGAQCGQRSALAAARESLQCSGCFMWGVECTAASSWRAERGGRRSCGSWSTGWIWMTPSDGCGRAAICPDDESTETGRSREVKLDAKEGTATRWGLQLRVALSFASGLAGKSTHFVPHPRSFCRADFFFGQEGDWVAEIGLRRNAKRHVWRMEAFLERRYAHQAPRPR